MATWWDEIKDNNSLMQGDILDDCHVPKIILSLTKKGNLRRSPLRIFKTQVDIYDAIVLTQSCDLSNKKVRSVLLAPVHPLKSFQAANASYRDYNLLNKVREGGVNGLFLLPGYQNHFAGDRNAIVDFKNIFTLPLEYLQEHIKKSGPRLRLNTSYRDRLSQNLGMFLMRVALDEDIPEFKKNQTF